MNIINSFITCPACRLMHEARVWVCNHCKFEHPPIVEAAPAEPVEAVPAPVVAPAAPELTAAEVLASVKAAI